MKKILKHTCTLVICFFAFATLSISQNSLLGDGFGGRSWYKSYNYSVGSYSAYTVCGDSDQLYGWGGNNKYELGDGTNVSRLLPKKVNGMTGVNYYTAGYYSAVIKYDSSGWVWGWGGTLKNGPRKVIEGVTFACAGAYFTSFVLSNGKVASIGNNSNGAFGNTKVKNNLRYDSAITMEDMGNAVRVSNTLSTQAILTTKGTVYTVGLSYQGELGLGDTVRQRSKPTQIPFLNGIVDVKSTAFYTVALNDLGEVYIWGRVVDSVGFRAISTPEKIKGLQNIIAISAKNDGYHSLFLDKDSNCYALGENRYYQLGTGDNKNRNKPTLVAKGIVEIMAAETFSFAINRHGQLIAAGKRDYRGNIPWFDNSINEYKVFDTVNMPKAPFELCTPKITQSIDTIFMRICQGDSFLFDKAYRKDSGTYYQTRITDGMLDTNNILHLSIVPHSYGNKVSVELCEGARFSVEGKEYEVKDSLRVIHTNQYGCDSIVTYNFIRKLLPRNKKHITLCEGESFELNGQNYIVDDSLECRHERVDKCDSLVTYIFTRKPKTRVIKRVALCRGELFFAQGKFHQTNQSLVLSYPRPGLCDSVVTYAFTYLPYQQAKVVLEKCANETLFYRNHIFKDTGSFKDTVANSLGCDSVITYYIKNSNSFRCHAVGLSLPNTFTPNGDGYNDVFEPFGINMTGISSEMNIFTRWGTLIYHGDPLIEPWDGTIRGAKAAEGTYFYHFSHTINGLQQTAIQGIVNLLR